MYCKVKDGQVASYPYKLDQLRIDNNKVGFPAYINNAMAARYDVYPVVEAPQPAFDELTQKVEKASTPTLVNGIWTIEKTVVSLSASEIAENSELIASNMRSVRDRKLASTDWTQFNDSPLDGTTKQSWSIYRQSLRDMTNHANFPYLDSEDWPTTP